MSITLVGFDKKERGLIREVLKSYGVAGITEMYDSFYESLQGIYKSNPSLVVMDLDNQDISPVEMLKSLRPSVAIIAVSEDKEIALRAFEFNVIDFLSKPLNRDRMVKSIVRFNEYESKNQLNGNDDLFIKDKDKLLSYRMEDILYIEALQNYILIHTVDRSIKIHMSMKQIEQRIPRSRFARVHRSYIVNIQRVHSIKENDILLDGRDEFMSVTLSKTYRKSLFSRINIL